jgi:hypothetical protein
MDANEYEVDQILDHDEDPVDGFIFQVKWKHYPTKMATWEPALNLDCPDCLRAYFHKKHLPFPTSLLPIEANLVSPDDPGQDDAIPDDEPDETEVHPSIFHTDPRTYKEAVNSKHAPRWREAMDLELANLAKYGVFELAPRPKDFRPVPSKWVYKLKNYPDGSIDKFRARIVAKGFKQRKGHDYDETFSPVISHTALRIILTFAIQWGWIFLSYDVIAAYFNSPLDQSIWIKLKATLMPIIQTMFSCFAEHYTV